MTTIEMAELVNFVTMRFYGDKVKRKMLMNAISDWLDTEQLKEEAKRRFYGNRANTTTD